MEWLNRQSPLLGSADLQCIRFTCYQNGEMIEKDEDLHYTKLAERLQNGVKYGLIDENIEQICVYRQGARKSRMYHAFVVLKTEEHYYSIERWWKFVAINRSNILDDVVENGYERKRSKNVERETDWVEGKGTVWEVIDFILDKKILEQKFNFMFRNCQIFSSVIFKNFNNSGIKLRKYRTNSQPGFPLRRAKGFWNLNRFERFAS